VGNLPVRIGQIGFGYWGPKLLRSLLAIPGVRMVGVADLDGRRLLEAQRDAGWLWTTGDYRALLARRDIDAIVISTPAPSHAQIAREALVAGKHVLVEKPLTLSVAEGAELIALADERRLVLMVGHTFLYNAAVRRLKTCMVEGELGDILHMSARRLNPGRVRSDVNVLWSSAPHDVSVILYLLDRRPIEVAARGFACVQPEIEDVVVMTLQFPGNLGVHVHVSWLDPHKVREITVLGSRKLAVFDDVRTEARLVLHDCGVEPAHSFDARGTATGPAESTLRWRNAGVTMPTFDFPEPLQVECEHFIDCIVHGQRPLTDGRSGLAVVEVLVAAQQSLRAGGRPVPIAPVS
jgi:predicted dehydrogenase